MTLAAEEPEQILSQDARGCVLATQERRELLLAEYDRSGMSGVRFSTVRCEADTEFQVVARSQRLPILHEPATQASECSS